MDLAHRISNCMCLAPGRHHTWFNFYLFVPVVQETKTNSVPQYFIGHCNLYLLLFKRGLNSRIKVKCKSVLLPSSTIFVALSESHFTKHFVFHCYLLLHLCCLTSFGPMCVLEAIQDIFCQRFLFLDLLFWHFGTAQCVYRATEFVCERLFTFWHE